MSSINTSIRAFLLCAPTVETESDIRPNAPHRVGAPGRSAGGVPELQSLSELRGRLGCVRGGPADTAALRNVRVVLDRSPAQVVEYTPHNDLCSGPKIGTIANPENSIKNLDALEVHQLALTLGKATPHDCLHAGETEREVVRKTLASFATDLGSDLAFYDNTFLDRLGPIGPLLATEVDELKALVEKTHMNIACETIVSDTGSRSLHLRVYFNGTKNMRDAGQDMKSGLGLTGSIDQASKRIGELFAKLLAPPQCVHLDLVSGLSMGGGSAQVFMAAIESRVALPKQPVMILLDPVLLNNRQAQFAKKDGDLVVDYAKPHGIAVTLDYAKQPHRGLMTKMKTFGGYKYPGLVQLKLGLDDNDGNSGRPPKSFPRGLGYHSQLHFYAYALQRFSAPG